MPARPVRPVRPASPVRPAARSAMRSLRGPERQFAAPTVAISAGGVRLARRVAGRGPEPVRAVHQLVPMLVPGDATSDHAIQLRRLVRDMGFESEIFAAAIHDSLHDEGMLIRELPDRRLPGTLFVYQMSSGSPMVETARERKEPLAVNYHNLTPAHTYDRWEPADRGRPALGEAPGREPGCKNVGRDMRLRVQRRRARVVRLPGDGGVPRARGHGALRVSGKLRRGRPASSRTGIAPSLRLPGRAGCARERSELAVRRADRTPQGAAPAGTGARRLRAPLRHGFPARPGGKAGIVSLRRRGSSLRSRGSEWPGSCGWSERWTMRSSASSTARPTCS